MPEVPEQPDRNEAPRSSSQHQDEQQASPGIGPGFRGFVADAFTSGETARRDYFVQELLKIADLSPPQGGSETTTALEDLQYEVQQLLERQLVPKGWEVLAGIASESTTDLDTLRMTTALFSELASRNLTDTQWSQLAPLLTTQPEINANQNLCTHRIAAAVLSGLRHEKSQSDFYSIQTLCGKVSREVSQILSSPISGEQQTALCNLVTACARLEPEFSEFRVMRDFVTSLTASDEIALAARALEASLHTKHAPSLDMHTTIYALRDLFSFEDLQPHEIAPISIAVEYHLQNGWKVSGLISRYNNFLGDQELGHTQQALTAYSELTELFRQQQIPLSSINGSHIEQVMNADTSEFGDRLTKHLAAVHELREMILETNVLRNEHAQYLEKLEQIGPNPGVVRIFRDTLEDVLSTRPESPAAPLHCLDQILSTDFATPADWSRIEMLIAEQSGKDQPLEPVLRKILSFTDSGNAHAFSKDLLALSLIAIHAPPSLKSLDSIPLYGVRSVRESGDQQVLHEVLLHTLMAERLTLQLPYATDEIAEGLLRHDSKLSLLAAVVATYDMSHFRDQELYKHFHRIEEQLSDVGEAVFAKVLEHQLSNAFPCNHLFKDFHRLAATIDVTLPGQDSVETWMMVDELVERLIAKGTPIDFLGRALIETYSREPDENAVTQIAETLELLHELVIRHELPVSNEDAQRVIKLLNNVAEESITSIPAHALTELVEPQAEDLDRLSIEQVSKILENRPQLTPQAWGAIAGFQPYYREHGFELASLIEFVASIDATRSDLQSTRLMWQAVQEIALDFAEQNLPFDIVTREFLDNYLDTPEETQHLLRYAARGLAAFVEESRQHENSTLKGVSKSLMQISDPDYGLLDNPAMVHKLNLVLKSGYVSSQNEYHEMIANLRIHALTDTMLNAPSEERREWARTNMRGYNLGGPPYVTGSEEHKAHYHQSMKVVRRCFRDNKGFGGMAIDCRTAPSSELDPAPPMIVNFGRDVARSVYVINSSDNNEFPGKGILLSGIIPEKAFAPDPNWEEAGKDSPFWQWTEGNGLFANEHFHDFDFEDLRKTDFLMMRGMMAVMCPGNPRFKLDGVDYSYVVYNRHFYSEGVEVALLVPTVVLQEKIRNTLVDIEDFRGFNPEQDDAMNIGLGYLDLLDACEAKGLNLLDLTYGSVIGGGLCNAYLPESAPHYTWEREHDASAWTDRWGHIHKSFILGGYGSSMNNSLDEQLGFARELQEHVYDVSSALMDQSDAMRFALSFYKMGSTLISTSDDPDQDLEEQQFEEEDEDDSSGEDPGAISPGRYRMLEEIYRWRQGAAENGWPVTQIPILHSAYVLDPNNIPSQEQKKYELDLATMVLTADDGETVQFPKDGTGFGDEERDLWRIYIVPHFSGPGSTGWEPRMLMRDGAFAIKE